jgi:phthiocerol/phenolphthiocerol synthesis type-I polyketide synthase E
MRPSPQVTSPSEGVAIIGMSARFPRSRTVQEFWTRLLAGEDLISDLSAEALRHAGVDEAALSDPNYVRRGNAIEEADSFDADFFGYSRREAEILDPQQRVFLECVWEALENAGHTGDGQRVGVFAGAGMNTYVLQLLGNPQVIASAGSYQLMLSSDKDFLTSRAAYKLNLHGPAVTVQTACSTSLAAVHLACRSILDRECDMAVAGGVSISFPQAVGYHYIPGMILSPDGFCRPFDGKAGGTVPGRGAGVVVLKRLSDAVADGDHICAVIRGSAWNNDGAGKVGYTAPSVDGQAEVIRSALAAAGITAAAIGYVETHGTATELGDAIEIAALNSIFSEDAHAGGCILGAVKANMGHADVAAGVAGLIKAALAVESGLIPPTPHFEAPSPALSLDKTPFVVSGSAATWSRQEERWAGVSSFGIGGTNVHVVLSSPPAAYGRTPDTTAEVKPARPRIFPVSARTESALDASCKRLAETISKNDSCSAADVSFTLQTGRRGFAFRRAVVAPDCTEAASLFVKPPKNFESGIDLSRDVVFLFPGQGSQFSGMAGSLYREHDAFRSTIDRSCEVVRERSGIDLLPFLTSNDGSPDMAESIRDTSIAQPALFVVEYALAEHWMRFGAEPVALLGHSLGELSAACVAGVFSLEDGLSLAAERGRLMARTPPGLMLAVMLSPDKLASYLDRDLWLAAENGPKMSVVSGPADAVEALERKLKMDRLAFVRLAARNAFHTPLMSNVAKQFRDAVAAVPRKPPSIPWLSNLTGTWIAAEEAQSPQYWGSQILSPVRFTRNLDVLAQRRRLLIEVGPGETLIGLAHQQLPTSIGIPSTAMENRRDPDDLVFLRSMARAWECGTFVDWQKLRAGEKCRRVALPGYPFERKRFWIDFGAAAPESGKSTDLAPATTDEAGAFKKRTDVSSWFYAPSWQSTPPANIGLLQDSEPVDCWLILLDDTGFGDVIVSSLEALGKTVIPVSVSKGFSWTGHKAKVNPSSAADYRELWTKIMDARLRPTGLVNLWPLNGKAQSPYEQMILLLQGTGRRRHHLRKFEFVTASLESVAGERIERPEQAELHGLARVVPTEFSGAQCRCIDLEAPGPDSLAQARQLVEEIFTSGSGMRVALRRGRRWQMNWTPAPLPAVTESPFRTGGVYLITGGLGGVGYVIAGGLVRNHRAHVVLIGRTELPARDRWDAWLAEHGEADAVSRRILRIRDLEDSEGEVLYVCADVADRNAIVNAVNLTRERFGELNGVIHAAGVAGGSMLLSQDLEDAHRIRLPKIEGTLSLAEASADSSLDFFVLCSSISSVMPAVSEGAYAAGNTFQNACAEYCRSTFGLPAVAIGMDAWQEVGMIADFETSQELSGLRHDRLRLAMTSQEGTDVMQRVLKHWRQPMILVSTVGLQALSASAAPGSAAAAKSQEIPSSERGVELTAMLEIWRELMGMDEIEPDDNFFGLGGHSLMGTMMIARIRDRLGVTLSLRQLFETPTAIGLAEIVRSQREHLATALVTDGVTVSLEREEFEI